jgi:hypothetical protein
MKVYVDPPSGWQYGFPKVFDPIVDGDVMEWIVKEGYPQSEIDKLGNSFYFRSWDAPASDQGDGFQQGLITKKGQT